MRPDPPELRRKIQSRMIDKGFNQSTLSEALGMGRKYLNDYFGSKMSPKFLRIDLKMKLVKLLGMTHTELGITDPEAGPRSTGFRDDGVPYEPGPDMTPPPAHIKQWTVTTRALDQHPDRVVPGTVLAINTRLTDMSVLKAGEVVAVELLDKETRQRHAVVFRQFLPPNKITTNSSTPFNEIVAIDDPRAPYAMRIIGVRAYGIVLPQNGNRLDEEHRGTSP